MERISVFEMLKIGVGPSSSHTLGPWRAAQRFIGELQATGQIDRVAAVRTELYGSLALTGVGHGTDVAILLGLSGEDPEFVDLEKVTSIPASVRATGRLRLAGQRDIGFDEARDLEMFGDRSLPFHANGMTLIARDASGAVCHEQTYYSVGGGFVVTGDGDEDSDNPSEALPYPINSARELQGYCDRQDWPIWRVVHENEKTWRPADEIRAELLRIWRTMKECAFRGSQVEGELPGGLRVKRRAPEINRRLLDGQAPADADEWIATLASRQPTFAETIKWIGCFAIGVNEENASFGRVVTAPTNGAAGVIPAVLLYYLCFSGRSVDEADIARFLLVAGEIGSLFKKGATISAAMGGCQAEIGVSSAMAAAALTEGLGGSPAQALMAAEIAMEHHLGLTCDPVGGLVQVPCIERNSMGAVKAITATNIALESDPAAARVSLDDVIRTLWETAKDMHSRYKETSQGGLAVQISVDLPEC